MAAASGEDFVLEVSTDGGTTWNPVGGMNSWGASHPRDRQEYPVFGSTQPVTRSGRRGHDYQASGYYDPVDPGQVALRGAARTDDTVRIRSTHDGTNGFTQDVKVGTTGHDADADPASLQETSFEFYGVADPVVEGTGPLP